MSDLTADIDVRTRVTAKVLGLAVVPVLSSVMLLCFAWDAQQKFDPADSARLLFAGIPFLLGGLILLFAVGVAAYFSGRRVQHTNGTLVCRDLKGEILCDAELAVVTPQKKGLFRVLTLTDGERSTTIPAAFVSSSEFAQLVELVETTRRQSRQARDDSSYRL